MMKFDEQNDIDDMYVFWLNMKTKDSKTQSMLIKIMSREDYLRYLLYDLHISSLLNPNKSKKIITEDNNVKNIRD